MLRVAFAGTPAFAVPTLRALAASHTLVGVLTQPDRPAGRGRQQQPGPVHEVARTLSLPLAQPPTLRGAEQVAALRAWAPDVLVVIAYGLLLPPAVLALPRYGCLNVHASLLPRWRGAAPIQRAILAGDVETGITIMQMEEGLDTGAILAQRALRIDEAMTGAALHDALAALGARLLVETLVAVESGTARARAQPPGATYAAKIHKGEARIDWSGAAEQIARQVRAFNAWPVAETQWQGQQVRIWQARAQAGESVGPPGSWLDTPEGLCVACGQGRLHIEALQLPGRRVIGAAEFLRGAGARAMERRFV